MKREDLKGLTIADALERITLNGKKMDSIAKYIETYSAWNSNVKCPYGVTGDDSSNVKPEQTFKVVREKIKGLMDSFNDLYKDNVLLKSAINFTNLSTKIETVLGVMSVHDAIYIKDNILKTESKYRDYGIMAKIYSSIEKAKNVAEQSVDSYNNRILSSNISEDLKKNSMASVVYFINEAEGKQIEDAVLLFAEQVNKRLNSINALTQLIEPPVIE